jgi:DNA-binding FadR family transcriptional regulator
MPRQPLTRVTLIDSVVHELEKQILSGEYPSGTRLPGEETLAGEFGVSRPVIREGLSRLRERGYLDTVNGRGTFVRLPDVDDLSNAILRHLRIGSRDGYSVDSLYEARTAIEATAARLAAERADSDDVGALRAGLADMRRHRDDPASYTAADVGFHVDVARAARNPFLTALLVPLAKVIVRGVFTSSNSRPDGVALGIRAHGRLLKRIEAHDPDGAAEAMTAHLKESRRVFPDEVLAQGPVD